MNQTMHMDFAVPDIDMPPLKHFSNYLDFAAPGTGFDETNRVSIL